MAPLRVAVLALLTLVLALGAATASASSSQAAPPQAEARVGPGGELAAKDPKSPAANPDRQVKRFWVLAIKKFKRENSKRVKLLYRGAPDVNVVRVGRREFIPRTELEKWMRANAY